MLFFPFTRLFNRRGHARVAARAVLAVVAGVVLSLSVATAQSTGTDTTGPRAVSAETSGDGSRVTISFDEAIRSSPAPDRGVSLIADNAWVSVRSGAYVVEGQTVTVTPRNPVTAGQTIRAMVYGSSRGELIRDLSGNVVQTNSNVPVTNNVVDIRSTLLLTPDEIRENGGESVVTATLNEASTADTTVTVSVTPDAGATAGDVTLSTNRVLTIAAGATTSTGTVTITANDNSVQTSAKTFTVSGTVANVDGVGTPDDVQLTIDDDDGGGICGRMRQVREAILAKINGVTRCADVTDAHLSGITGTLDLSSKNISSLQAGDFAGLSSVGILNLYDNALTSLPSGLLAGLSDLNTLYLDNNALTALPSDLLASVRSLDELWARDNALTKFPSEFFAGKREMSNIQVYDNPGDSDLKELDPVASHKGDPLGVYYFLESLGQGRFKIVVPVGTAFETAVSLNVINGTLDNDRIVMPAGRLESDVLTVTRTPGTSAPVSVDIVDLRSTNTDRRAGGYSRKLTDQLHNGIVPAKSGDLPLEVLAAVAPGAPGVTATPSDGAVRLTWTAPEYDGTLTGWELRYGAAVSPVDWGKWTAIEDATAETVSHRVTGLENGTAYVFEVRAMAGEAAGAASNTVGATPKAATSLETKMAGSVPEADAGRGGQSGSPSGGCAVEVSVEFLDAHGDAVAVGSLAAADFTVTNGRAGTPVAAADGLGWTVPVRAATDKRGFIRVRLPATERWRAAEQVFHIYGPSVCAPAARWELATMELYDLSVSPPFNSTKTSYTSETMDADAEVLAEAVYADATVTIAPADADEDTDGHQVALPVGETEVTVTVTPADGSAANTYTVTVTREGPVQALTGFVLVDASTDTDLGAVTPGSTVTVAAGGSYGIRAEVKEDAEVGSVMLMLRGPGADGDEHKRTENIAPYSLYGDAEGAEHGRSLAAGSYMLTATAYADRHGAGRMLNRLIVPFKVAVSPAVTDAVSLGAQALTASLVNLPERHDGTTAFSFELRFSEDVPVLSYKTLRDAAFTVTDGRVIHVRRLAPQAADRNRRWEITVEPGAFRDVAVTLPATTDCAAAGAVCHEDGRMLSGTDSGTVPGPVLSVADARAEEGTDATLDFAVTLAPARTVPVTVAYATADVTATSGSDYTATSGTLTFQAGETSKTISVPVLDDRHDEGSETLTLSLATAAAATIADGAATGTITNSDPLQRAWLARFGRTAATHVTDAVGERLRGAGDAASHLTIGGYRLPLGQQAGTPLSRPERRPLEAGVEGSVRRHAPEVEEGAKSKGQGEGAEAERALAAKLWGLLATDTAAEPPGRLTAVLAEVARVLGVGPGGASSDSGAGNATPWRAEPGLDPRLGQSRTLNVGERFNLRQVLLGSSFRLALNGDASGAASPRLTAWGRFAGTTFAGQEDDLAMDGDVFTGTVGVDSEWDRWLAGIAVAHSRGDGSFTSPNMEDRGRGGLEQTLTSLHPYLRYAVTDRLDVWGLVGYGWGELDVELDSGVTLETDTTLLMGAFGGRGIVLAPDDAGGYQLATRTDAMLTRTSSDAAANSAATDADAHRVRVILEGSRAVAWTDGRSLTPTVELGVRHDWGDAETGFGLEVGGRVQYADPRLGLTVEGAVRGLLAHEDADYEEWGASGTVRLAPGAEGHGLSLTVNPTWGAAASGVEGLWSRQTTQGLAPQGNRQTQPGRLQAEVGYGFAAFDMGLLTPYAGTIMADGASKTYRTGVRWVGLTGLSLNLEGTRQELAGQQPVNQGLRLQVEWGF